MSAAPGKREKTAARPWRRLLHHVIVGLIVLFAVIQVVPYRRSHTDPATTREPARDSPAARRLFMSACDDCHSHATRRPRYTNIAPVSWPTSEMSIRVGRHSTSPTGIARRT